MSDLISRQAAGTVQTEGEKTMIQINIDMPKSCLECPCSHGYAESPFWDVRCNLLWRHIEESETDRRQEDCPLKEVKDDEID